MLFWGKKDKSLFFLHYLYNSLQTYTRTPDLRIDTEGSGSRPAPDPEPEQIRFILLPHHTRTHLHRKEFLKNG